MEKINYVGLIVYFLIGLIVVTFNKKSIWSGICGGNGAAQPDELAKVIALLIIFFDFGWIIFLDKPVDYGFTAMLLGMLGITAYITHLNHKIEKNKDNEHH
jgi:TctA family transporter